MLGIQNSFPNSFKKRFKRSSSHHYRLPYPIQKIPPRTFTTFPITNIPFKSSKKNLSRKVIILTIKFIQLKIIIKTNYLSKNNHNFFFSPHFNRSFFTVFMIFLNTHRKYDFLCWFTFQFTIFLWIVS